MKIAMAELFGGRPVPRKWTDHKEIDSDYVRTSEIIEVEFVDLPDEIVVPAKVAVIDRGIEGLRAELGEKIARLEDEKAKLLAITHEEVS